MLKQRKWMLLAIALMVFIVPFGWAVNSVLAAPEEEKDTPTIIIKAKGSYGNYTRSGSWLPLEVEVTNQGEDIKGKLRVVINDDRPEYAVDYSSSAVVPQGSTKLFNFYIPVQDFLSSFDIELMKDDKVVAKQRADFNSLSPEQFVIGLVDRTEEGFASMTGLRPGNRLAPIFITVKNEALAEKAELLNLFDVLVIDDVNLKLTDHQALALTHWVSRGGTLVVGGGSGWQKVYPNLPKELQVVNVSGVESKALRALPGSMSEPVSDSVAGPVRMANLQSTKGKALFPEQGQALAQEYQLGDGKVFYLAFDPALEPMSNWSGMKVFWRDLLLPGKDFITDNPASGKFSGLRIKGQAMNTWGLMDALNNIQAMDLPSLRRMFIALAIYLLLAGIINYLVLKKLDKRELTWFTVPAVSIVFVLLIYFTSFQTRPSEVISHQINIIDVKPGTSLAKLVTATGIFAPTYNKYSLELDGRHLVRALPNPGDRMNIDPQTQKPKWEANIGVEHTNNTEIEFRQMRSWVMRGFSTVEDSSLTGTITGEVTFKDNKWLATITNTTKYDFTDGVIVSYPSWFTKIGALKAGDKIVTEINVSSTNINNGPPFFYQIYNPQANWKGPGAPPRPEQKDLLRQRILETQFGNEWEFANGSKVFFLGWSDQPFAGGVELKDNQIKKFNTSLFKVPLNLKFDPAKLEVPEGILTGTLFSSKNVDFGPPGRILMREDSEAVYQVELPEGSFSEMQLNLRQAMQGNNRNLSIYLYNWQTLKWEEITLTSDNTVIRDHSKYIDRNRQVRFRVTNQRMTQEFFGVNISLTSKGGVNK
ncbi:MAG: hypothetical protein M0T74_15650 [Desulfitobacterium hafniense]|nr:hypothetical protein [Desulfitobacterium hafniense]